MGTGRAGIQGCSYKPVFPRQPLGAAAQAAQGTAGCHRGCAFAQISPRTLKCRIWLKLRAVIVGQVMVSLCILSSAAHLPPSGSFASERTGP